MTLVLETGAGVRDANSYILAAFVTQYLTDRGRQAEGSWVTTASAGQDAACVAATDYIDRRWGSRLKGSRATSFRGLRAEARLDFGANPSPGDTLTLGDQVYTYVSTLSTLGRDQVLIGGAVADTVQRTVDIVNGADNDDVSEDNPANRHAQATLVEGSTTSVELLARQLGVAGNDIALSSSGAQPVVTSGFVNGLDAGSQPLEFPRVDMFDQDGNRVVGIPLNLKHAAAEYAVRANQAALFQDPSVDETGRAVTERFEKVGPIEERTRFEEGAAVTQLLKPYPAADRLMRDYLRPAGTVLR